MRRFLDGIYYGTGCLAALLLLSIAVLVVSQIVGRMFGAGALPTHNIAGFFMVASLFLGLAYTMSSGEHVRVSIIIEHVGEKVRWWMELWCLAVGAYLTGYFAYFSGQMAWESYVLDYRSDGLVGIPYFIPQGAMVLGLGVLFIRLIDELVQLVRTGEPLHFRTSETSPSQESANDMTGDASGKRER